MRPLTADGAVRMWETGQRLPPIERDLLLLAAVLPEQTAETLGKLTIGAAKALLFEVRRAIFGDRLDAVAACDSCGDALEFSLDLRQLPTASKAPPPELLQVPFEGETLQVRPLRVRDLRRISACPDAESARQLLAQLALVRVGSDGDPDASSALPDPVLSRVARALAEADDAAELLLDLPCPACGYANSLPLDPGDLLWSEVRSVAVRALRDVHALATAYGWGEDAILSLSPERRAAYLSLIEA